MSGPQVQLDAASTFSQDPEYTLFSTKYEPRDVYVAETFEVPFDRSAPAFGGTVSVRIPPKADLVRRLTVRSELPGLYTPLGPGYVYPYYSDQVDGSIYVAPDPGTQAIVPGDFTGYFNTQFTNLWATNFVGYTNMNVVYNSTQTKFIFYSSTYSNIFFRNEASGAFWGFDPRAFDFVTVSGYKGYNFSNGVLTPSFTLEQAGWIRGYTPPPTVGFSYVDSVACQLIKSATLTIGGQVIDRLTSERLVFEDDLGVAYENQTALTLLEGKHDASPVTTSREYYTRLTFNMDTLNMNQLYRNDVRVDLEFSKFENLATNVITTNGFFDGGSYVTSNLAAMFGTPGQTYVNQWMINYKDYIIIGPKRTNGTFQFYNQSTGTYYTWNPTSYVHRDVPNPIVVGGIIYISGGSVLAKASITSILANSTLPFTSSTYSPLSGYPVTPYGDGNNSIYRLLADARYVYMFMPVNYYTIGGIRTSLVSPSLGGDLHTWTAYYNFYNVTPPLTASSNSALVTMLASYASGYTTATVAADQALTVALTPGASAVTQLVLTFAAAPGVSVNNIVYNSGSATQITSYVTGPIRVIEISGATVTIQFPSQIISGTIPIGTKVSFQLGPSISTQTLLGTSNTRVTYSAYYTAVQTPGVQNYPAINLPNNWLLYRYDTTMGFNDPTAYTVTTLPSGQPASMKDVFPGTYNSIQLTNSAYYIYPVFDGRFIYLPSAGAYIVRVDTQNFTSPSAWTQVDTNSLSPPVLGNTGDMPCVSDGTYLYTGTSGAQISSCKFTRYNSNLPIDSQAAWEYYTGDTATRTSDYEFSLSTGFDGKYVYYYTVSTGTRKTLIHRYDTTKPFTSQGSWSWLDFRTDGTVIGSDGSRPSITLNTVTIVRLVMITGTRYMYFATVLDRDNSGSQVDFVQYNPLTMSQTLESSVIVKYEKYEKPPTFQKSLYGQTELETFTMKQGRTRDTFEMHIQGSLREFWVAVESPGVVSRIILRVNNEILVDDDATTTTYTRPFESHTSMPSYPYTLYSVSIDPELIKPTGTINFSRIAQQTIEVTLTSPAPSDLYVRVYSKVFNVIRTDNGLGGLLFNSAF
jgi:hypothetical protein